MKKLALGVAAALLFSAGAANASTVSFDFSSPSGNLGYTNTYTSGALNVVATGYNGSGALTALYGKHQGGTENGLGLANDPSGQNEIHYGSGFVQLDVSGLIGKVDPNATFFGTNSTTQGETWGVYGSNSAGSYNVADLVTSGMTEGSHALNLNGAYRYYDFVSIAPTGGENYLLANMVTSAVPEPATWSLMLLAFAGLGFVVRRQRAVC